MKKKKLPTDVAYNVINIGESRKVDKRKTPGPETGDLNDAFRERGLLPMQRWWLKLRRRLMMMIRSLNK